MKQLALFCALVLACCVPILPSYGETTETVEVVAEAPPAADPSATVIIPDAAPPPMPKKDWQDLILAGAISVFLAVELGKKTIPWFAGKKVWLLLLPAVAATAVIQVSYADPKLLAKHAALLLLFSIGGRAGAYKIFEKVRKGEIPDPPDTSVQPSLSEPPVYKSKPPTLPLVMMVLFCAACGPAQHPCVALYQKAGEADTAEEIRKQVAEADKVCEHMLEKEGAK